MRIPIIIGSRGSRLALWQANYVQARLKAAGLEAEIKVIKTQGDQIQDLSFDKMEGKGFFTKEIEAALLDGSIDLAVHSHKDLETTSPEGLCIAAVPERADPSDVLVIREEVYNSKHHWGLRKGSRVATGSARRRAQLKHHRPDLELEDLRGNVPTRLEKLHHQQLDAIVLAKAGLDRLEIIPENAVVLTLNPEVFIPAPAQGALALQVRESDEELRAALAELHHESDAQCIEIERSILRKLEGGCRLPFGARVTRNEAGFELDAAFARKEDYPVRQLHLRSSDPEALGALAFEQLTLTRRIPRTVFFSRDAQHVGSLQKAMTPWRVKVESESLIQIESLDFELPEVPYQWIFFSSRNAVRSFFKKHKVAEGQRLAAIGQGTAKVLKKYGSIDFVGQGTETKETAKRFAEVCGDDVVFFPISSISQRTVQQALKPEQVVEVVVYETREIPKKVPPSEVVVLTSPSNARAYLAGNEPAEETRFVTAGQATTDVLEAVGKSTSYQLTSMSSASVARAIFTELFGL